MEAATCKFFSLKSNNRFYHSLFNLDKTNQFDNGISGKNYSSFSDAILLLGIIQIYMTFFYLF